VPIQHRLRLHQNGPALWPEHKPLDEVLDLKATTPEAVWEATYQGNPTPPGGTVFQRSWWRGQNRFDAGERALINRCVARWISWDTGLKDQENNAYTSCTVGELQPEYHLIIREVWRDRLKFPDLPEAMESFARRYNRDEKLRGVIIEDKVSGTSAYQTLSATSADWLKPLLVAFMPTGDKTQRAQQAAVWCKNGCIWLPAPGEHARWLVDFEDELFNFPGSTFKDQVDSFSQLVIYLEHFLSAGWRARKGS
jgi:predicted phage terminase large subunit-like protein